MRKRKNNYGREVLFNLLGILAIVVLFAAGMFDGIRLKWTANPRTQTQNRDALSGNSLRA